MKKLDELKDAINELCAALAMGWAMSTHPDLKKFIGVLIELAGDATDKVRELEQIIRANQEGEK